MSWVRRACRQLPWRQSFGRIAAPWRFHLARASAGGHRWSRNRCRQHSSRVLDTVKAPVSRCCTKFTISVLGEIVAWVIARLISRLRGNSRVVELSTG
uniref:Uncharacterized protein n=1 Tax=Timema monikensis TaxID=170555 RepID=A0A7R9DYM2_9NEOP|nr:unnamed protein product [Timema monikensis]